MPAAAPRARPRARPRVAPPARAGATAASWTSATAAGGGRRAGRDAEAAGDAEHRKKSHPERAAVPYVLRRASPHTAASAARMRPPLGMALAAKVAQGRSVVRGLSSSALRKRSQSRLRRPAGADSRRPPSSSEAAAASPRSAQRTIRVAGRGVAATRLGEIAASPPRRRCDTPPRNICVAAAASPLPSWEPLRKVRLAVERAARGIPELVLVRYLYCFFERRLATNA